MEETKTIEYIIGGLGLLFFIGIGAVLGYLWNELRWRNKETKRDMVELVAGHIESTEDIETGDNPLSLKNLKQKE